MIGARNIEIDGVFFDVEFLTGTCAVVFNGCDSIEEDFRFSDDVSFVDVTYDAVEFVLNQVLVDSAFGNFDSDINAIRGCDSSIQSFCSFFAPIGFLSSGSVSVIAISVPNAFGAPSFGGGPNPNEDLANEIWLRFFASDSVAEIPLPAAAFQFLVGLLIFFAQKPMRSKLLD